MIWRNLEDIRNSRPMRCNNHIQGDSTDIRHEGNRLTPGRLRPVRKVKLKKLQARESLKTNVAKDRVIPHGTYSPRKDKTSQTLRHEPLSRKMREQPKIKKSSMIIREDQSHPLKTKHMVPEGKNLIARDEEMRKRFVRRSANEHMFWVAEIIWRLNKHSLSSNLYLMSNQMNTLTFKGVGISSSK